MEGQSSVDRSQISCLTLCWSAQVEFAKSTYRRRVEHSVTVTYRPLCIRCVCDRGFSMFSHRKIAELSCFFCSVIFLSGWLSFEPNFEAQLALEVPQRAFRPSFSDLSHSRDRRFDLAGSAFDFGGLSAADRCRSFASVRKMTSEAGIPREKQNIRSFCIQTLSLEPWRSLHFGLLS